MPHGGRLVRTVLLAALAVLACTSRVWGQGQSAQEKSLARACASGDVATVQQLVEAGASASTIDPDFGASPIFITAAFGHVEVMEALRARGEEVLDVAEHEGYTPLHMAAREGHTRMVQFLVEAGQDVETRNARGATALWLASYVGAFPVVKLLTRRFGASSSAPNTVGETPLFTAAEYGHMQVVKHLVEECGASPNSARALDGTTAIAIAAFRRHRDMARYLYAMGANPLAENDQGINAVVAAEKSGDAIIAGFMRQAGEAAEQGLNYSEFVERIEGKRKSAETSEHDLRRELELQAKEQVAAVLEDDAGWSASSLLSKLSIFAGGSASNEKAQMAAAPDFGSSWRDSESLNATLLYEHALSVASLRRDGEAKYELQRALALSPDAAFAPGAKRLIHHVEQSDVDSMQKAWQRLAELDELEAEKSAHTQPPLKKRLAQALELRERVQFASAYGGDVAGLKQQATSLLEGVAGHVQQNYGVDMQLRSAFLEDEAFPFTRGGIYGPGLASKYDCSCSHKPPGHTPESRENQCSSTIVVESWRFITHSYGLVGQQYLLGLLQVPRLCVRVMNPPYLERLWTPGLPGEAQRKDWDEALRKVPLWKPGQSCPDVVIRSYWPLDTQPFPCNSTLTLVFGATEHQRAPYRWLKNIGFWNSTKNITLLTPSQWSAKGFVNDGVPPELIRILPHGFDDTIFHPSVAVPYGVKFRKAKGWEDDTLVFLHVGSMIERKGVAEMIKAFASTQVWFAKESKKRCMKRHSASGESHCIRRIKLVLKGSDRVSNSAAVVDNLERKNLGQGVDLAALFQAGHIEYIGEQLSTDGVAAVMAGSDVYVSAYKAEGFNIPVLEAAAVGLPIICTHGGPTAEFTRPEFARHISAKLVEMIDPDETSEFSRAWMLEPDVQHLTDLMMQTIHDSEWRASAAQEAAKFVHQRYTLKHITHRLLSVLEEQTKQRFNIGPNVAQAPRARAHSSNPLHSQPRPRRTGDGLEAAAKNPKARRGHLSDATTKEEFMEI